MKTPTQMNRSSASLAGMTPSATLSATAMATARCAGPNICTACFAPLMVTLLNITVAGLHTRFGATTASRDVKPSLLLVSALQNADSTALPRGPINRSMWATSLPSPTSDSPMHTPLIFAIFSSFSQVPGCGWNTGRSPPLAAGSSAGADSGPGLRCQLVQRMFQVHRHNGRHRQVGAGSRVDGPRFQLAVECLQLLHFLRRVIRPAQRVTQF